MTCASLLPTEELIDDMDKGSQFIPSVHGRAGSWQVAHDTTPNVTMFPPDGTFSMSNTNDPCRLLAVHVLGAPYNASAYKGISFWAKVGPSSSPTVRVAFPDKDTDPAGGTCSTAPGAPANGCFDHWGSQVPLSQSWTKVTVRFSNLTQAGWGNLVSQFDASTVFRIHWEIPAGATFDIWVDDLAFLTQ
jgi:hypothetical protein